MPKFEVRFERDYTLREGFNRVIEAATKEEAETIAAGRCDSYNHDCPDDCSEIGGEGATDFEVNGVYQVADTAVVDDEED